jgi:asparagine synthase (glutamine-hydrolysing)
MDLKQTLKNNLIQAVEGIGDGVGVLFSGGVDSTAIAAILKNLNRKFTCYTAGFPGSKDIVWAEETASQMAIDQISCEIGDIEEVVRKIIQITGLRDPVNVSIAIPLFVACSQIKEKVVITGMGADELFAGYESFKRTKDVNELSWKLLKKVENQDLLRDRAITSHFNLSLKTPFLNLDVIRVAMQLPEGAKLADEQNKIILREIACDLGVPKSVCNRKKRAAQYGSGAMKELKRLAKHASFKSVTEYLNII